MRRPAPIGRPNPVFFRNASREEEHMKRGRYLYALAAGAVVGIAFGPWNQSIEAKQNGSTLKPPTFKVDPFWPKPLPDNWVTGEIGGTSSQPQEHTFFSGP